MIDAVRNLVALGAPVAAALAAATSVPARIAGRSKLGTLAPGSAADIVVLDDSLEIVRVLVRGADALD
jgi:N-acetylglucosamine-6-phosphate deacetylase